jgi:chemotaxis protein methyltransferase CheR
MGMSDRTIIPAKLPTAPQQSALQSAQQSAPPLTKVSVMDDVLAIHLSESEFEKLSALVYDRFGIYLPPEKRTMVNVRLQKVLKRMGLQSFGEYYKHLTASPDSESLIEFANHITTNHTFFFREKDHFEYFSNTVLPEITTRLKQQNDLDLRVWSAGCSSGEEAYMLAMLMIEFFGSQYNQWKSGVLATDISERALATAVTGVYTKERIGLLPEEYKRKYFQALPEEQLRVKEHVQRDVVFRKLNLMNEKLPFKKLFHVIFCRNVMIYFDKPTRDALVDRFYNALAPGGYLFIGHSETITRTASQFRYVMPALYQKPL